MSLVMMLPSELLILIDSYLGIKCNTCLCDITISIENRNFFIKQGKKYYCSKECYNFI